MKWSSLAPLALVVSAVAPQLAAAGMYREPAVELDAKSFKRVMATEQASVSSERSVSCPDTDRP